MSTKRNDLSDGEARRRIREDLAVTLFVEAAAGTGKTSELVARIICVIRSGAATLKQIVAVTFTEKAAGEMKLRLREAIEQARALEDDASAAWRNLDDALSHLEEARIGTIHSFCADLLHQRPVEARVDPLFEVASEDESDRLLGQAFNQWFEHILKDPPEGVRRILRRRPHSWYEQGPRASLRNALRSLVEHRDFPAPWRRESFDRQGTIDKVMQSLSDVARLESQANWPDDWLAKNLREIGSFIDETQRREAVRGRDYDGLEAELRDFSRSPRTHWHWRGSLRHPFGPELPRETVIDQRNAAKAELDTMLEFADADLASCLHEDLHCAVQAYENLKQKAGRLDFLDLLLKTRDLLRDNAEVRTDLQTEVARFFVDEFQDTDPLQAEILLLLSADDAHENDWLRIRPIPGKLFLVGDPKQSIYRFRRADVAVYEATKERLAACGAEVVQLTTSFRSVPSIQLAVNAAFEPHMPLAGSHQARFVPLAPWRLEHNDRPTIIGLPVPQPYGDYGNIVNFRIEQSFPEAVGAFVDWLVHESGWKVSERGQPDERVPIGPRHVCILFRRFKKYRDDVTRPYVRALETRRVPHVLVGGHSFHEREEVLAIRNALFAIEWPDDELRVFATLRGPLFGFGDDALLAHRHRFGSLHPMRRIDAEALDGLDPEVAEALALLARLHVRRNRRPVADTISQLLEEVRAHAGIAIWPTGEQALANCLRVIDLARRFERRGAPSFRAFVERMEEEAERGDARDAPMVEEGTEGVRIMTVHKAKGLEFPVVILADPTCKATRDTPTRHIDPARKLWAEALCGCAPRELLDHCSDEIERDREEAVRLAYVAVTRARDLLVAPVVGDREMEGWMDVLNPVLYPTPESRRDAKPGLGCPKFGGDSVLERPYKARADASTSVAPGLHTPQAGRHKVVWWDPKTLELDKEETVGLRQQRILEADKGGAVAEESIAAHDRWQRKQEEMLARGATPSLTVYPVTGLAARQRDTEEPGEETIALFEATLNRSCRPHGKRFGTLVHAALAVVDLEANESEVLAITRSQARLLGSSDEEIEAAALAVGTALAHPLLQRAATSAALYRETPLVLSLANGSLAEGVVDLAFREDVEDDVPMWTVVDFKTDHDIAARRGEYEAQVRLYVEGIRKATGENGCGALLIV